MTDALNVFLCYSREDESHVQELLKHLGLMRRQGLIDTWHNRQISAGDAWRGKIDAKLKAADIILLLVSPSFLASDYIWDVEANLALKRHAQGAARVIPVIVRPCEWRESRFAELQALPKDGKPVTRWPNKDEAWLDVTTGLRRTLKSLVEDLWSRIVEAQGRQGDLLFDRFMCKMGPSPQALAKEWAQFLNVASWHDWVEQKLDALDLRVDENPDLAGLEEKLATISLDESCPRLAVQLQDLVAAGREKPVPGSGREHSWAALDRVAGRLFDDLGYAALRPAWGRCFLLTGRIGEGKTHFVVETLRRATEKTWVLYLDQFQKPLPLTRRILNTAFELTGKSWSSAESLNSFLMARSARLVIVIDGLERWLEFERALRHEIEELTRFRSFYWLITLLETRFETVSEGAGTHGWPRLVSPPIARRLKSSFDYQQNRLLKGPEEGGIFAKDEHKLPTLGSWIHLSEINRREQTGVRLMDRHLESEGLQGVWGHGGTDPQAIRLLSTPFVAWIAIELHSRLPLATLVNLRFVQFIERFWKSRRRVLQPLSPLDLEQLVGLATKIFLDQADFTPHRGWFEKRMVERSQELFGGWHREAVESAVSALIDGNLLAVSKIDSGDIVDARIELLVPGFETFWNWRLARQLLFQEQKKEDAAERTEVALYHLGRRAPEVAEGVLEFLLLTLDQMGQEVASPLLREILKMALDHDELPTAAVWFFGAKASLELQKELFRHVRKLDDQPRERREWFSICHFLAELAIPVAPPERRLEVLLDCAPHLRPLDLRDYLIYIIAGSLREAENAEDVVQCMVQLMGCEELGVAAPVAGTAVWNLYSRLEDDPNQFLDHVLVFIEMVSKTTSSSRRGQWDRHYFWEWVLYHVCHLLASEEDLRAYWILKQHGWFDRISRPGRDLPDTIWMAMQRESNFALAECYRRQPRYFLDLTTRLSQSKFKHERQKAFYLIRHTRPTGKQRAVVVDAVFKEALERIFLDPRLKWLVHKHEALFELNLPQFEELEEKRQRLLAKHRRSEMKQKRRAGSAKQRPGKRRPGKKRPGKKMPGKKRPGKKRPGHGRPTGNGNRRSDGERKNRRPGRKKKGRAKTPGVPQRSRKRRK